MGQKEMKQPGIKRGRTGGDLPDRRGDISATANYGFKVYGQRVHYGDPSFGPPPHFSMQRHL